MATPASNSAPVPAKSRRGRNGSLGRPWPELSIPGGIFIALTVFMGMAAMNSQANLLFGVTGLMIGVFFITESISRAMLSKLHVHRVLPEFAAVGECFALTYECTNHKRFWASLSVTVSELDALDAFVKRPVAYMLHAAPRMQAVIATQVIPRRRGLHTLDRFQISTSFPFGFIRRASRGRRTETFVVYPAIGRVDPKLLRMCQSAESSGATLRPRRGGADEFYGVKEYRGGENPRMIYWRRSARTGVLVSKEMTLVAPPRLLLMVNTCLIDDSATEHMLMEKTIAMAASLASHALEAGLMVGVCLWSGSWVEMAPTRGKRHREEVLSILARVSLNRDHPLGELTEQAQGLLATGTTQVLLTPRLPKITLGEQARGGWILVSPASKQGNDWFEFDPTVDFGRSMPLNQQQPPQSTWRLLSQMGRRVWRRATKERMKEGEKGEW